MFRDDEPGDREGKEPPAGGGGVFRGFRRNRLWAIGIVLLVLATGWLAARRHATSAFDRAANDYAHEAVMQIATTFAIAKTINAALSVTSTISVGAVVGIQPGKALEPVDRLIDDFSDYLLMAATLAALTELLVLIGSSVGTEVVLPLCLFIGLLAFWLGHERTNWRGQLGSLARSLVIIMLVLRFGLPGAVVATHECYARFLAPYYESSKEGLQGIEDMTRAAYVQVVGEKDENSRWFGGRLIDKASDSVDGVRAAWGVLRSNYDRFFTELFTLMAILTLRILVLPIICGYLFSVLVRRVVLMIGAGRRTQVAG